MLSHSRFLKVIASCLCLLISCEQVLFAQTVSLNVPANPTAVASQLQPEKFRPVHLRLISYDPQQGNFRLLLDKGSHTGLSAEETRSNAAKLFKYFLIGLAIPNDNFWVNLRPDGENDIIEDMLTKTDIGRIMLESDVRLKKDTARFTSPEYPVGKQYWQNMYKKAQELFGQTPAEIPTLIRPWIVPSEIIMRETKDGAYIYKATLKVMLEDDYLSENSSPAGNPKYDFKDQRSKALNEYSAQQMRELIIPLITREVNSSAAYAELRQVYYSLILAQWYKARFRQGSAQTGSLSKAIDSKNLSGLNSTQAWDKTDYFQAYQDSFRKGEYNVSEYISTPSGQVIRRYVSGGERLFLTNEAASFPHSVSSGLTVLPSSLPFNEEADPNLIKARVSIGTDGKLGALVAETAAPVNEKSELGITEQRADIASSSLKDPNLFEARKDAVVYSGVASIRLLFTLWGALAIKLPFHVFFAIRYLILSIPSMLKALVSPEKDNPRAERFPLRGAVIRDSSGNPYIMYHQDYLDGFEYAVKNGFRPTADVSPDRMKQIMRQAFDKEYRSKGGKTRIQQATFPSLWIFTQTIWDMTYIKERWQGADSDTAIEEADFAAWRYDTARDQASDTVDFRIAPYPSHQEFEKTNLPGLAIVTILDFSLLGEDNGETWDMSRMANEKAKITGEGNLMRVLDTTSNGPDKFEISSFPQHSVKGRIAFDEESFIRYIIVPASLERQVRQTLQEHGLSDWWQFKVIVVPTLTIGQREIPLYKGAAEEIAKREKAINSGSVEDANNTSLAQELTKQIKDTSEGSSSSALSEVGGIDFRALPVITGAIANIGGRITEPERLQLAGMAIKDEWLALNALRDSGQNPSPDRIKEFIQASCIQGSFDPDKMVVFISGILRSQEEDCIETEPILKDTLAVIGASGSQAQLKESFLGITPAGN